MAMKANTTYLAILVTSQQKSNNLLLLQQGNRLSHVMYIVSSYLSVCYRTYIIVLSSQGICMGSAVMTCMQHQLIS